MNILHYTLGLPPIARGGLTKYVVDLLTEQVQTGHCVSVLWPGTILTFKGATKIKKCHNQYGATIYEIVNPLPLPQIYGIKDFEIYTKKGDINIYLAFLKQINPQVIHMHTLMGIHQEFLMAAKKLNIKIVFTSHDYFGICPKTTLFYNGTFCKNAMICEDCVACNQHALSKNKILILQSRIYQITKGTKLMSIIRRNKKQKLFNCLDSETKQEAISPNNGKSNDYISLRKFYTKTFELIDTFHFNSTQAEKNYSAYIKPQNSAVVNITHANIENNRQIKKRNAKLKLSYLGAIAHSKGFFSLKSALDKLYNEGFTNFELNIYSYIDEESPYINVHRPYKYCELKNVMNNTDLLIVPSFESFGFTVLEGLSYGCPVLVTQNVGAKDLIKNEVTGFICNYTYEDIKCTLKKILLNPERLSDVNKNIVEDMHIKAIKEHALDIETLVYQI